MDFKDIIKQLTERVSQLKENIATEEATKNAFIMPFINALGYDVFNPMEVVPEMDCDLVKKKGEKIDYAIMKDGHPIMLIECKHWKQNLSLHDNQLQKYFVASKAKFGVLTNGIKYLFYTDLINANIMDEKPFLEFDITEIKEYQLEELKKFSNELKTIFAKEFANPTPEFTKYFAKQVYDGIITAKIQEQFSELMKKSFNSYIGDLISSRLQTALNTNASIEVESESNEDVTKRDTPTKSGTQLMSYINESGLYSLVLSSKF